MWIGTKKSNLALNKYKNLNQINLEMTNYCSDKNANHTAASILESIRYMTSRGTA